MDIKHYEMLMKMFDEHRNEDGSSGFDIDKVTFWSNLSIQLNPRTVQFREVFGKILGDNLTHEQVNMLFMKIDANSDGTVDWNEFSGYMISGSYGRDENASVS